VKEEIMTLSVPHQGRGSLGKEHSRVAHASQLQAPHSHASASRVLLRMGFKSITCAGLVGTEFSKGAAISIQRCCLGLGLGLLVDHVPML